MPGRSGWRRCWADHHKETDCKWVRNYLDKLIHSTRGYDPINPVHFLHWLAFSIYSILGQVCQIAQSWGWGERCPQTRLHAQTRWIQLAIPTDRLRLSKRLEARRYQRFLKERVHIASQWEEKRTSQIEWNGIITNGRWFENGWSHDDVPISK